VRRAAALTAIVLLLVTVAAATPAGARRVATGRVVLRGQPAWSSLGDDVQLRLGIRSADPALEVNAVVHSGVSSRIAFERTINGERLGSTITSLAQPVAALPVLGADRILTLPLQDPAAPRDPNRIRLTIPGSGPAGVFPVEIELRTADSGEVLSSFVTHLVAVRRAAAGTAPSPTRLQVAWLWHVAASPSTTATGAPSAAFAASLGPTGRLGHVTQSIEQLGGVPVTLVPNPETVAGALGLTGNAAASAFLSGLREAAATSASVLSGPFTTIDGPALLHDGLDDATATQLAVGRETLERDLRAAVDNTIAAPQPLDAAMLDRLRTVAGTTRLVVDPRALTDAEPADQYTPARPFRLDSSAGSFGALEVNRMTSDLLVRRGADALRAQQVLAGLTVVALEQPNRSRGVVIDTPKLWDARPDRAGAVLAGLRDNPVLVGARLTDIFDSVPAATVDDKPYVRELADGPTGRSPVTTPEYRRARTRVDALASMIGTDDPLVARVRHELYVTPANDVPRTGPVVSDARLATIRAEVASVSDKIIAPPSRTFRLTSRRASVPLSIENATDQRVRVRIRLTSQKLEVPDGAERIVELPPGNTTTQFDVESRASGTFPVLVTVSSPDGRLALQRSRYTIRSAFVSGVGVFLAVGAGLFLAIWWLMHWRRSRRSGAPALAS
jgi:hypothetical protein